jgi:diphthamide synthase (EF-2-diphthine--ammonia ligase)
MSSADGFRYLVDSLAGAISRENQRVPSEVAKIQEQLANAHGSKEAGLRSRMAKALVLQAKDEYKQDHVEEAEKSLERARSECERAVAVAISSSKETRVKFVCERLRVNSTKLRVWFLSIKPRMRMRSAIRQRSVLAATWKLSLAT